MISRYILNVYYHKFGSRKAFCGTPEKGFVHKKHMWVRWDVISTQFLKYFLNYSLYCNNSKSRFLWYHIRKLTKCNFCRDHRRKLVRLVDQGGKFVARILEPSGRLFCESFGYLSIVTSNIRYLFTKNWDIITSIKYLIEYLSP